jgi:hypothetical protein
MDRAHFRHSLVRLRDNAEAMIRWRQWLTGSAAKTDRSE